MVPRNISRPAVFWLLSLLLPPAAHCFCPATPSPTIYQRNPTHILKATPAETLPDANAKSDVNGETETASTISDTRGNPIDTNAPEDNDSTSTENAGQDATFLAGEQLDNDDDDIVEAYNRNAFTAVAARAALCLLASDLKRDAKHQKRDGAVASGATNWIDDASAGKVRQALDQVKLHLPDERTGLDRDEASSWIRWMKSVPTPMIINLSEEVRTLANEALLSTQNEETLEWTDYGTDTSGFLSRIGCRLVILPSGTPLDSALTEAPGSMIYGKLLFGGVSRYRLLSSTGGNRPSRRTGERTEVKPSAKDDTPVWIQYGGTPRMYESVDMGPAAVLEVVIMPRGQRVMGDSSSGSGTIMGNNMVVQRIVWKPQQMFGFVHEDETAGDIDNEDDLIRGYTPVSLSGKERNEAFQSEFQSTVGGLQPQIDAIVRRVLDGRVIRPAEDDSTGANATTGDSTTTELAQAAMEAEELALLGLTPVRGLLMYGPPGCGKTALAREISRSLRARAPKIVSAPELLDRWVGGSEKLVRSLFADAEAELAVCNGDSTKSALHVIVIDEIDAVFRKRSTAEDSGESTRSSVVNQILSKLDGVNSIPNVLLIGMTNRRELLDAALLRPGRLEVQIEIPLPNKKGRREILQIHFDALRKKGRLSKPLCCAIDGVPMNSGTHGTDDVDEMVPSSLDISEPSDGSSRGAVKGRKRRAVKQALSKVVDALPAMSRYNYDLAADVVTAGFSGADIAGLVRCAGSIALARARKDGNGIDGLLITLEDVKQALSEVKQ